MNAKTEKVWFLQCDSSQDAMKAQLNFVDDVQQSQTY